MKQNLFVCLLLALILCGCTGNKDTAEIAPVKVKTLTVGTGTDRGVGVYTGSPKRACEFWGVYTGTVEEENGVALSFNVSGTLRQLLVDEGQMVARGQLIAVVDGQDASNTLELSRAAVRTAQAAYDQAQDAYNRMKMIHDNGSLPDIKWVEAQNNLHKAKSVLDGARAQLRISQKGVGDTRLYAPFAGYISSKDVEIGQTVGVGQAVVNLVKIDQVKVKISVPETEISALSNGQTVDIRVEALGGRAYRGRITEKNVSADALSHTYDVKATVSNSDHRLLPGMIAEVETPQNVRAGIKTRPYNIGGSPILLSAGIIQLDADNRTFVWTVSGSKAKMTYVRLAGNAGDKVVVSAGLNAGDKVIISGAQKVSSGMRVTDK